MGQFRAFDGDITCGFCDEFGVDGGVGNALEVFGVLGLAIGFGGRIFLSSPSLGSGTTPERKRCH